jgi:hypothetical protein
MTTIKSNLLILLILPWIAIAGDLKGKYKKERSIHKSYTVSNNAALDIENKYGNVFVTTWDQNTTEIDVVIKVGGDNEKKVNAKFNAIDVAFSATQAHVSAVTKIGDIASGSNSNIQIQINYTVKIPKKGTVKIENQYGGIQTGKIYGKAVLNCQYGDLNADELNANGNSIRLQYCGSAKVNSMGSGNVVVQYSQFHLGRGTSLQLDADYSGIVINDVKNLSFSSDYGEVKIENAGAITGKGDYSSLKLGRVNELLNLTAEYGDIIVETFDKKVRNIAINSSYTNILLGFYEEYPFDFELSTEYAGVFGTAGFKFTEKIQKNNNNYYKGYYKNSGENKVYIKSEYGNIQFMKDK